MGMDNPQHSLHMQELWGIGNHGSRYSLRTYLGSLYLVVVAGVVVHGSERKMLVWSMSRQ